MITLKQLTVKQAALVAEMVDGPRHFEPRDQRSLKLLARVGVAEKARGPGGILYYPPRWQLTRAGRELLGLAVPERPRLELVR